MNEGKVFIVRKEQSVNDLFSILGIAPRMSKDVGETSGLNRGN